MQDILVPNYLKTKLFSLTEDESIRHKFISQCYLDNNNYSFEIVQDKQMREIAMHLSYHFCNTLNKNFLSDQNNLEIRDKLIRLGTKYGGWHILPEMLSSSSIVYSVGAGNDISFDLEIIEKFDCEVFSFDPTPQALEYVFPIAKNNNKLTFLPYGVMSKDTILKFFRPQSSEGSSLSATNLRQTNWSIEAPVLRLRTIMNELKHDYIDVLKLDIEGAEYDVIEDAFFEKLDIRQLSVEFDQPTPPWRTEKFIKKIIANGYDLVNIDALNFTFIRNDILEKYI